MKLKSVEFVGANNEAQNDEDFLLDIGEEITNQNLIDRWVIDKTYKELNFVVSCNYLKEEFTLVSKFGSSFQTLVYHKKRLCSSFLLLPKDLEIKTTFISCSNDDYCKIEPLNLDKFMNVVTHNLEEWHLNRWYKAVDKEIYYCRVSMKEELYFCTIIWYNSSMESWFLSTYHNIKEKDDTLITYANKYKLMPKDFDLLIRV